MTDHRTYALTSFINQEVYKSPQDRLNSILGFTLLPEFNHAQYVAYISPSNVRSIVLAFRGTAAKADIATDAALAVGQLHRTSRAREAVEVYDRIRHAYPDYRVVTSGHSLGGSLSEHVSRQRDAKSIQFNPGQGIDSLHSKGARRANRYRTGFDPVSYLGRHMATTVPQTTREPHGLNNFIPDNALM